MGSIEEPKRLLCWTVYITKRQGQSSSEHHQHVSKVNVPLTLPFLEKYGVVRYTVKHNDEYSQPFQHELLKGVPGLEYDSMFEMIVRDLDCIQRMQADEKFLRKCLPDHFNFADLGNCKASLTWIEEFNF